MFKNSNLQEWLNYLENLNNKKIKLDLYRIMSVYKRLNLPKINYFVFTVAGTNGKGTTCRTLEILLISAGYRVGVYSSPHLLKYTERIRIQNCEIPEEEHVKTFQYIMKKSNEILLTYFEYSTLSAFILLSTLNLDIVIFEVGLGGRLDATNIIDSDIAIITNINFDHMNFLGNTLESIGFEKAGIFRSNKIAIFGDIKIPRSVISTAKKLKTNLLLLNTHWNYIEKKNVWHFKGINKKLYNLPLPKVPIENVATALAALDVSPLKIKNTIIYKYIKKITLPGRFEIVKTNFCKIIFDVAHNPHAAAYLAKFLINFTDKKIHAIVGMLKDKDIFGTLSCLQKIVHYWYCATISGINRSATSQYIRSFLSKKNSKEFYNLNEAFFYVKNIVSKKQDIILVFGSFYTVSEIMKILKINK